MAITLPNGYIKPETGDRGNTFFKNLEDNIERLDGHTHDGQNSNRIPSRDLEKQTQTILADDWGTASGVGNQEFTQTITMPTDYIFDETQMIFKDVASGAILYPEITRTNASEYTITMNDNTLEILVIYV